MFFEVIDLDGVDMLVNFFDIFISWIKLPHPLDLKLLVTTQGRRRLSSPFVLPYSLSCLTCNLYLSVVYPDAAYFIIKSGCIIYHLSLFFPTSTDLPMSKFFVVVKKSEIGGAHALNWLQ